MREINHIFERILVIMILLYANNLHIRNIIVKFRYKMSNFFTQIQWMPVLNINSTCSSWYKSTQKINNIQELTKTIINSFIHTLSLENKPIIDYGRKIYIGANTS